MSSRGEPGTQEGDEAADDAPDEEEEEGDEDAACEWADARCCAVGSVRAGIVGDELHEEAEGVGQDARDKSGEEAEPAPHCCFADDEASDQDDEHTDEEGEQGEAENSEGQRVFHRCLFRCIKCFVGGGVGDGDDDALDDTERTSDDARDDGLAQAIAGQA